MNKKVYVIHENDEWVVPLRVEFKKIKTPFKEWHMGRDKIKFNDVPPNGIFYNRMSASSHSRGHRYAPEETMKVLKWLESHNKRIVNNSKALNLEISKQAQYIELKKHNIKIPETFFCKDKNDLIKNSKIFKKPFIIKHNRGGRGLGIKYFKNSDELVKHVNSDQFEPSIDGITLIQEYIVSTPQLITRVELVNSQLLYAVQVDATESFELCPADACNLEEKFCPANPDGNKFMIVKDYKNNEINKYLTMIQSNGIEIAGIEYIKGSDGEHYTYDINTNTNYNLIAEKKSDHKGMHAIANFLSDELKKI
tara:strand:- start:319 stop:1245 length:927 start_codon:yes stop_codon:yes gene_type:complete